MRINKIKDFIAMTPNCEFCGETLATRLTGKAVPDHHHSYEMGFDATEFYDPAHRMANQLIKRMQGDPQISYVSDITGNSINYYYELQGVRKLIISIDLDTNQVTGNTVEHIQNILWDHKMVLLRFCGKCKRNKVGYVAESSQLHFERRRSVIMPFTLDTEVYNIEIKDKVYSLMSSTSLKGSFLVSGADLIKELPYIPLHHLRGADIITNKIKTILVFS